MAKEVITRLVDDLDGGDADESVRFGLDGVAYEIDLSGKNAAKLRDMLGPYVASGTRTGRLGGPATYGPRVVPPGPRVPREQLQAVRDWAKGAGYAVSDRGRIPGDVQAAYDEAHKPPKKTAKR